MNMSFLVQCRGPRKRPKMVGMGKSGFDSLSYAELYEEHDWHLIFDVWWPHDEQIKDFRWPPNLEFQSGGHLGLAGNSNHKWYLPEIQEISILPWLKIVPELSEGCPEQYLKPCLTKMTPASNPRSGGSSGI